MAERKLPYDVVYLLNRYFEAVGSAIRDAGGVVNQFTGDGVRALFGVDAAADDACRHAIRGAGTMIASLEALSRSPAAELPAPLRLGIGIHVGPAVVGRMGFAEAAYLTAVGDTVHVAARLEELTLRNRSAPLAIRVIADARRLAAALPDAAAART